MSSSIQASSGPLSPQAIQDPFTYFDNLRESDPVHWEPSVATWLVTRYDDVLTLVRSPETYSSSTLGPEAAPSPPIAPDQSSQYESVRAVISQQLIRFDPPAHSPMRQAMHRHFTPPAAERLRAVVRQIIDERLAAAMAHGTMDVVKDFALPLPLAVISELLGISPEDRENVGRLNDSILRFRDEATDRMSAIAQDVRGLVEYFSSLVGDRLRDPKTDLMNVLVDAELSGIFTREQVIANAIFMLDAGHSTTISMITNGLLTFLRHPEQWKLLKAGPLEYIKSAVEEVLRYEPPLKTFDRVLTRDATLRDRTMRAGERVRYVIASANRDPRQFPRAKDFDILRSPNAHLSFGTGFHHCLGSHLARLEAQEVFLAFATRLPQVRLVGDESDIEYRPSLTIRQVKNLIVTW